MIDEKLNMYIQVCCQDQMFMNVRILIGALSMGEKIHVELIEAEEFMGPDICKILQPQPID